METRVPQGNAFTSQCGEGPLHWIGFSHWVNHIIIVVQVLTCSWISAIIDVLADCLQGPLRVPLDKVFVLGQPLSLKFTPVPETGIPNLSLTTLQVV